MENQSQLFARKPHSLLLEEMRGENRLRRVLGPVQLSSLGVGAIIGTGIFVLTGIAAHDRTGPALMLSFVVAGLTCIFAALCYAEFASMVPVAGSAYTYAYATLGELFAWIIGWDLVLEYAVASATVAHGWSHYFQDFLASFGMRWPLAFSQRAVRFRSGHRSPCAHRHAVRSAGHPDRLPHHGHPGEGNPGERQLQRRHGHRQAGHRVLRDRRGCVLRQSGQLASRSRPSATPASVSSATPLLGQTGQGGEPLGMLAGAAIIFFAYIGFDSVSTHAEEAKNPPRDVPIGIIVSLVLCTVLYIAVAGVLTGMVPYNQINIDAPVSDAFGQVGLPWARVLISVGAVAGITSVLLVMMLSQPRIFLAMARDGLLPHGILRRGARPLPHAVEVHDPHRLLRCAHGRVSAAAHPGRTGEHRHAAGLRDRLRRGADHAAHASRSASGRSARRWVPSCRSPGSCSA